MKIVRQKIPGTKGDIFALIYNPAETTDKLAVICPGYLDTKDYEHLTDLAKKLCGIGYSAVVFDPTGTWESGGDISDYTNSQYLDDIKTVLDFMLKQASYKKILLGGHSRGGQVSILYSARDPRISEVVAIMPSSSKTIKGKRYEDWEKQGLAVSFRDIPGSSEKKEFRVPYSHVIDRKKYDVFEDVKKVNVPIVFVAGELDSIVLPEDVKRIYDLASEPKKYVLMNGIGHDYRQNSKEIEAVNRRIIEAL